MCSILKKCKRKLGLSMLIPFESGKDETKCVELATWNRRLDRIDKFCGFQISLQHPTHQCKFDINLVVSKMLLKFYKLEQCVVYLLLTLLW
jgi:hypothetical protein